MQVEGAGQDSLWTLAQEISDIFHTRFRRARRPNKSQCYHLAISVTSVKLKGVPNENYQDTENRKRSQKTIEEMKKIIGEAKRPFLEWFDDVPEAFQSFRNLTMLESALACATNDILGMPDPGKGKRANAWWHYPARFLAIEVQHVFSDLDQKPVSYDKRGPFVRSMVDLLGLAGINKTHDAVAKVINPISYHQTVGN